MDLRSRVAKNLRDIRIAKGVSQEDLAHRAKLNRNYIGMLESGKNSPTVKTLEKIAQALEIDAADFFYRGHKTVADN
jgi:transcriptional regulator with XRE-family HTH domain